MENFISELASKYPLILTVLGAMGVARLIFKPLFTFLRSIADATPSIKDNQLLDGFMGGKIYAAICWFLDLTLSVKLPGQK